MNLLNDVSVEKTTSRSKKEGSKSAADDLVFDIFISGDNIDLVVLTEEIARESQWYNWFNDEELTRNMQKRYFPNTATQQVEFYRNNIHHSTSKLQLGIYLKCEKTLIGVVSLNEINYINRACEFSIIVGVKKFHNMNNFREASSLIINHAFQSLNMNRIYSGTISKQIQEFMCKVLNFSAEGVAKQAVYKDGKYHDVYLQGLIKENMYKNEI